jgi:hypothetical protein
MGIFNDQIRILDLLQRTCAELEAEHASSNDEFDRLLRPRRLDLEKEAEIHKLKHRLQNIEHVRHTREGDARALEARFEIELADIRAAQEGARREESVRRER